MNGLEQGMRRVLIPLSGLQAEQAWLDAAAEVAACLDAELTALFVEDLDLLKASRLPSMREIGLFSAQPRALDGERILRLLQAAARRLQQTLERVARARGLAYSFRILQGKPLPTLLQEASSPDLVLIVRQATLRLTRRRPVAVLFDGSLAATGALSIALRLARASRRPCVVLVAAADPHSYRERVQQVGWAVGEAGEVLVQALQETRPERLVAEADRLHAALLVVPAAYIEGDSSRLMALYSRAGCDLLLVT